MNPQDTFKGSPWNATPSDEWNQPAYWNQYYNQLQLESEAWRRELVIHRDVYLLFEMLTDAGEVLRLSPQTLLDAGCGISYIPHILAACGFQVTAVDSCPHAIETSQRHQPSDQDMARCIRVFEPNPTNPIMGKLAHDPVKSLERLNSLRCAGGSVAYANDDWLSPEFQSKLFSIIYCRNSLRCATKLYWRQTLQRFHELLNAGGILLLENTNAIGIQDEVNELLTECGFSVLELGSKREPTVKYVSCVWPTG